MMSMAALHERALTAGNFLQAEEPVAAPYVAPAVKDGLKPWYYGASQELIAELKEEAERSDAHLLRRGQPKSHGCCVDHQ